MDHPAPSLGRALTLGTLGFTAVSLAGFSVWAFAGQPLYATVGEAGLYAVTALVFVGLAGLLLHPLLAGSNRFRRFYALFVPAFLLYSIAWSGAWFALGSGLGEWLGSLAGSVVFAGWICWRLGRWDAALWSIPLFFGAHSAGYFLGGVAYEFLNRAQGDLLPQLTRGQLGTLAKLSWGLWYGLGFGAGMGAVFYWAQRGRVGS
jgi:hypothetical protein